MKTGFVSLTMILGLALAACGGKGKPAETTAPATPAAKTCAQGEMLHEGECLKECGEDQPCPTGYSCEQLHLMNDDGSIGPVAGNACTKD